MIALIQRVSRAQVDVAGQCIAQIDAGILALIGIRSDDDSHHGRRLLERLLGYRVFSDEGGRMNLSLRDIGGGLLLVPQFTLAADTHKGMRPGFSTAAAPETAQPLFEALVAAARAAHGHQVAAGQFGAAMQLSLINDGPVTFWLESAPVSG